MPEGVDEVPTIGIIYPPPEVRSILYSTTIILLLLFNFIYFNLHLKMYLTVKYCLYITLIIS